MKTKLATQNTFQDIAEMIFKASEADDTFVGFSDSDAATLRFANDQVIQNVAIRRPSVSIRVAYGKRVGRATTDQLDRKSVLWALKKAQSIALLAPEDPEFMPSLERQTYTSVPSYRDATAEATPLQQAHRTKPVIDLCREHGLSAAGIMTNATTARGVAASSGLFGYEQSTAATFSLTATGEDSTGWTMNTHRDINKLDVPRRTRIAVDKAVLSQKPREIEPGHYTVILEPSATAGIFGPVLWSLSAKSYYKGDSPFVGKLGTLVFDTRMNVRTDPTHPDVLGSRFAGNGMASRPQSWITNGVLEQLYYDRFTAKQHGKEPNPFPRGPIMSFDGPTAADIEGLVKQTKRGVLITNFWYIRFVNPADLTLTGMTRDGTFLVEDGKIVSGLRNFRFHESPLRAFRTVDAATAPMEATSMERGKSLLPAVKLPEFNLSSVTKF